MAEEEGQICSWTNRSKAFKTPNLAGWVTPNLAGEQVPRWLCDGVPCRGCQRVSLGAVCCVQPPDPWKQLPKTCKQPLATWRGGEEDLIPQGWDAVPQLHCTQQCRAEILGLGGGRSSRVALPASLSTLGCFKGHGQALVWGWGLSPGDTFVAVPCTTGDLGRAGMSLGWLEPLSQSLCPLPTAMGLQTGGDRSPRASLSLRMTRWSISSWR